MGRKEIRRRNHRAWVGGLVLLAVWWIVWAIYLLPNTINTLSLSFSWWQLILFTVGTLLMLGVTGLLVRAGLENHYFQRRP